MDAFFNRVWARRGVWAVLLWPLSLLYAALSAVRRALYAWGVFKTWQAPVAVLVVGNVRVGGGGKSPTVLAVLRHLRARGLEVAVLSRGYGRSKDAPPVLRVRPDTPVAWAGDEPLMLARLSGEPVFVARSRVMAAQAAMAELPGVQVLVADDGLQHLALGRDVELVVHSGAGMGNGWLLPAGPLRERWPRPVDLELDTAACRRLSAEACHGSGARKAWSTWAREGAGPVYAVAAIAHPEGFFSMLRQAGLRLQDAVSLPDHHDFSDWRSRVASWPENAIVLCTEKDAVKLAPLDQRVWWVPMVLEPDAEFWRRLDALIDKVLQAKGLLPSPSGSAEPLSNKP